MREFGRAAGINDPGGVVRLKAKVGTKGTVLLLRQDTAWRCIDVFTSRGGVIPPPTTTQKKKEEKERGSVLQEGDAFKIISKQLSR